MLMAILSWMLIGLVVGAVARALMPGTQPMSALGTMGLGIAGALLGGLAYWLLIGMPRDNYDEVYTWPGWILSVVGAIVILLLLYGGRKPKL